MSLILLCQGGFPLQQNEENLAIASGIPYAHLNWNEGKFLFPSLRILPKLGVENFSVTFTLITEDNDALETAVNFRVKPCRPGSVPPAGVGACLPCQAGKFALPNSTDCMTCTKGATCNGGQDYPGGMGIHASRGFWQAPSSMKYIHCK